MGPYRQIQDGTARGAYEGRLLSRIEAAWPDREVHYLFGGYMVTPKGTPLTSAATLESLWEKLTLESLWEKLMSGKVPPATVPGTVLRSDLAARLSGPTEEVSACAAKALAQVRRAGR
jgi:hypothetical protein